MSLESMEAAIAQELAACESDIVYMATASQMKYQMGMQPGEVAPSFGRYDVASRDDEKRKAARVSACYERISEIIDSDADGHAQRISEPARADDVATVQLALSREYIGADELAALYDRYGYNYQLAAAIREKAHSVGVHALGGREVRDPDEAKTRASDKLRRRYLLKGSTSGSSSLIAESIMQGYTHTTMMGGSW